MPHDFNHQQPHPHLVEVLVSGPVAMFTRPETKVERVSYPVMTPTAAIGILESILWKPQMHYRVTEIAVLKPIRYASIGTTEVSERQTARQAQQWADEGGGGVSAQQQHTRRQSRMLRDVAYVIRAIIDTVPGSRYGPRKYVTQFNRRVQRGQCYMRPYLGTRECAAEFEPVSGDEQPIDVTRSLGNILLDLHYRDGEVARPQFFAAHLDHGVMHVPDTQAAQAVDPGGGDAWLQWLTRYSDRLDLGPSFYSERTVRYWLDLDADGNLLSPEPVDTSDPATRATRAGTRRIVPMVARSSDIKPRVFADSADYTLGITRGEPTPRNERLAGLRHSAYQASVEAARDYSGSPATDAVLTFLKNDPLEQVTLTDDFDPAAVMAFRVDGVALIDDPRVQEFWADANSVTGPDRQCLVCLEYRPAMERMSERVKRVRGAVASGLPIISANSPAFESWGLKASLTAALCLDCARRATMALNALMPGTEIGGTHLLAWADDPDAANPLDALFDREADLPIADGDVYLLAVSANVGRLMIRDAVRMDGDRAAELAASWRVRQGLAYPVGLNALVGATVRSLGQATPALVVGLARGFMTGEPLPLTGLMHALRQATADGVVNRGHAALIRLVLTSHEQEVPMALDPEHDSIGYQCGRMLAALVLVERALHGGNTRSERRMTTASVSPRRVFPRLMQQGEADLRALQGLRERSVRRLRSRIAEIAEQLPALLPDRLSLTEQGEFMIGYYHELVAQRRRPGEPGADPERSGG